MSIIQFMNLISVDFWKYTIGTSEMTEWSSRETKKAKTNRNRPKSNGGQAKGMEIK